MRLTVAALCVVAAFATSAFGQNGPYLASVSKADAPLYVNPSNQSPTTENLALGTQVLVDHEEANGMLAVQPAPGSIRSLSWVQIQFIADFDKLKPTPQNVTVAENTTLAPGKVGSNEPIAYHRKTSVPAGTILTVIGPKITATVDGVEKSWYPVLPPSGDFRYIPKEFVKVDRPVNTSFTIHEGSATPVASIPSSSGVTPASAQIPPQPSVVVPLIDGPPVMPLGMNANGSPAPTIPSTGGSATSSPPPTPKPVVQHPLWTQAEAAEQEGRLDDAEKLYFQLARQMNEQGGDRDVANLCYTRIHSIREKKRAGVNGAVPRSAALTTMGTTSKPANVSVTTTGVASSAQSAPQKTGFAASGKMLRSVLWIDGLPTYVLESGPGVPIAYVVAGGGVNLERCVNHIVEVTGTSSNRKDTSKPVVVASSAEIAQ